MNTMLLIFHYMINPIYATPHYHLMPTLLTIDVTTSLLSVKTKNLMVLFIIHFYCFDSIAIITTFFLSTLIYMYG
jgi:hypothetical protein